MAGTIQSTGQSLGNTTLQTGNTTPNLGINNSYSRTIFLPYEILMETGRLTNYKMHDYPIDIATSIRSVETRTLLPGGKDKGSISISIDTIDDISHEVLMNFYDLCKGALLAFEIREDHSLWVDMMPAFARYHWYPLWRFESAPNFTCRDSQACIWDVNFTLMNVPI
jgi:hypothetical protein